MARVREAQVERLDAALKHAAGEAVLYEKLDAGKVRCVACGHRCVVLPGLDGVCRVRFNRDGVLYAPRGYVAGVAVDPIEKKPFFHVLPGAKALSFGMLGCDFHCGYCQNWLTSQALRDPDAQGYRREITAAGLVAMAKDSCSHVMVSTYNEPLITSEWAVEVFRQANEAGILCGFVSNGNATPEALAYLRPHADLYKVDLKGFRQASYRQLGGRLDTVLDTIGRLVADGFWVEVVTLVVPGFNDSVEELGDIARFLVSVSPEIPWHVTGFRADYRMGGLADTTARDLERAAAIGMEAGLHFVYAGNRPGAVGDLENTRCPGCGTLLVERSGYRILAQRVGVDGRCPACARAVPGRWAA
jgi:pyruvate formate lyase activating enzyme